MTSPGTARARSGEVVELMLSATDWALPASTSQIRTRAPSLAKSLAHSAPIPWPEPVTIAVWL